MAQKSKKEARERISEIAQRWFLIEPLLFSMYCTHVLIENNRLQIPLKTGKGRIEYNASLIEDIDDSELADRLKVEALRILLKHPYQRQPYRARPEILYLASNMTILDNMGGSKSFCFKLVNEYLVDKLPAGKTFEEYYVLLDMMIPHILLKGMNGHSGSGEETYFPNDNSLEDNILPQNIPIELSSKFSSPQELMKWLLTLRQGASSWEEDSIMSMDINLIIQEVMKGPSKGWGTLPADFIELVRASLVPKVNMVNILKGFKKSILSQRRDLTRMRPSRRYGFEQMGSKYLYSTRVLVALDVSGSVDSEMLSRMLGLINRIFKQGVEKIDVIQFDAKLKSNPQPIRKTINTFKVTGRGGTNFQPAADFYMQHREYDGLIYITDGVAPNPVIPQEYRHLPVTWLIMDNSLVPSIRNGWNKVDIRRYG